MTGREEYVKFATQNVQKYYDAMVRYLCTRVDENPKLTCDEWVKKELDTITEQLIQESKIVAGDSNLLLRVLTDFILMAKGEMLQKFKEELNAKKM